MRTVDICKYAIKLVTLEEATRAIRSDEYIDYGFGAGFPDLIDMALSKCKGELPDVKIRSGLVIRPLIEAVEEDLGQESFKYFSWHIGNYERKIMSRGRSEFTKSRAKRRSRLRKTSFPKSRTERSCFWASEACHTQWLA